VAGADGAERSHVSSLRSDRPGRVVLSSPYGATKDLRPCASGSADIVPRSWDGVAVRRSIVLVHAVGCPCTYGARQPGSTCGAPGLQNPTPRGLCRMVTGRRKSLHDRPLRARCRRKTVPQPSVRLTHRVGDPSLVQSERVQDDNLTPTPCPSSRSHAGHGSPLARTSDLVNRIAPAPRSRSVVRIALGPTRRGRQRCSMRNAEGPASSP